MDDHPHPSPLQIEDTDPDYTSLSEIDIIRQGVNDLTASEKLDKESALTMTRLFHAVETLMRKECTRRDAAIAKIEHDLERTCIQNELERMRMSQEQDLTSLPQRRGKAKW